MIGPGGSGADPMAFPHDWHRALIADFVDAVAADLDKRHGKVSVSPDDIVIMPGGKPTMFFAMLMFGAPGKEIMYPDPGFPIYRSMIEYTGATPVPIPIREENGFAFSAEETLGLITDKTRLIIINSPANPTGGVTPKAEIDALVAGLAKFPDVAILSDEIYDRILYDGATHIPAATVCNDTLCATFGGLSKVYRACGFRVGWVYFSGRKTHAKDYLEGLELLASLRRKLGVFSRPARKLVLR